MCTHVCLAQSIPQDISTPGYPRQCFSDDECGGGGATCRLPSSTSPWKRWGGLTLAIQLQEILPSRLNKRYCHPRPTVEGEPDCLNYAVSGQAQFPGLTPQQGWPDALSNVDFPDLVFLMLDHWCIGSASMHANATSGIETMNAPALKVLSMQSMRFETFPSGVAAFLSRMTPGSGLTSALEDGCDNVYTYDPSNTSDPRVPCIHVDLSDNDFCPCQSAGCEKTDRLLDSRYAAVRKFALLCDAPKSVLAYASCEEAIHSLGGSVESKGGGGGGGGGLFQKGEGSGLLSGSGSGSGIGSGIGSGSDSGSGSKGGGALPKAGGGGTSAPTGPLGAPTNGKG